MAGSARENTNNDRMPGKLVSAINGPFTVADGGEDDGCDAEQEIVSEAETEAEKATVAKSREFQSALSSAEFWKLEADIAKSFKDADTIVIKDLDRKARIAQSKRGCIVVQLGRSCLCTNAQSTLKDIQKITALNQQSYEIQVNEESLIPQHQIGRLKDQVALQKQVIEILNENQKALSQYAKEVYGEWERMRDTLRVTHLAFRKDTEQLESMLETTRNELAMQKHSADLNKQSIKVMNENFNDSINMFQNRLQDQQSIEKLLKAELERLNKELMAASSAAISYKTEIVKLTKSFQEEKVRYLIWIFE